MSIMYLYYSQIYRDRKQTSDGQGIKQQWECGERSGREELQRSMIKLLETITILIALIVSWDTNTLSKCVKLGPGQVAHLVRASSWPSKVAGLIPGQGTYKNKPIHKKVEQIDICLSSPLSHIQIFLIVFFKYVHLLYVDYTSKNLLEIMHFDLAKYCFLTWEIFFVRCNSFNGPVRGHYRFLKDF